MFRKTVQNLSHKTDVCFVSIIVITRIGTFWDSVPQERNSESLITSSSFCPHVIAFFSVLFSRMPGRIQLNITDTGPW